MSQKLRKQKVGLVLGTRPEIIKLSPILRLLRALDREFFIIHTGQHYTYEMDKLFFRELDLPAPMDELSERSKSGGGHGDHTGRMMKGIENVLLKRRPSVLLVQGDTNSVLAGSLVAAKMHGIKLGHVEAGLRSYDRAMPEEINRRIADHVSDYLFAPTRTAQSILLGEGIHRRHIHVTGNTIVDAVKQNLKIARRKVSLSRWGSLMRDGYFLMTLHRQENVDHRDRLASILKGLAWVAKEFRKPILFPIHPRTAARLKTFRLGLPGGVRAVKPMGFLEFLLLESKAELLLTDSGGVQEESCILKVPCVTLRTSTERPETVEAGSNVVAGYHPHAILAAARKMLRRQRDWKNPFGDGRSGERILRILERDGR